MVVRRSRRCSARCCAKRREGAAAARRAPGGYGAGPPSRVLIRPERVVVAAAAGPPGPNRFHGTVAQTAFLGEATECLVQVGGVNILVRSAGRLPDGAGPVEVYFPPEWTLAIAAGDA